MIMAASTLNSMHHFDEPEYAATSGEIRSIRRRRHGDE
jgi:hypothetical protein